MISFLRVLFLLLVSHALIHSVNAACGSPYAVCGRYVRVTLPLTRSISCLHFSDIAIFDTNYVNRAIGATGLVYPDVYTDDKGENYAPYQGVDGRTNTIVHTQCVRGTMWVQYDLGTVVDIADVTIYNRDDPNFAPRIGGSAIGIWLTDPGTGMFPITPAIWTSPGLVGEFWSSLVQHFMVTPTNYTISPQGMQQSPNYLQSWLGNVNVMARYLRITNFPNQWLHVSDIAIFNDLNQYNGDLSNWGGAATATQTSTYTGDKHQDYSAGKAIDGNTAGVLRTFSHTNNGPQEYIEIDLGSEKSVTSYTILNRQDDRDYIAPRLNGAVVTLYDANRNIVDQSNPIYGQTSSMDVVVRRVTKTVPLIEITTLKSLFDTLGGSSWTLSTRWDNVGNGFYSNNMAYAQVCFWSGIVCDTTFTHVIEIDLSGSNLIGDMSNLNLTLLSSLTVFNVSNNPQLTGVPILPNSIVTFDNSIYPTIPPTPTPTTVPSGATWIQFQGYDSHPGDNAGGKNAILHDESYLGVTNAQSRALSSGWIGFVNCSGTFYFRSQDATTLIHDKQKTVGGCCTLWVYTVPASVFSVSKLDGDMNIPNSFSAPSSSSSSSSMTMIIEVGLGVGAALIILSAVVVMMWRHRKQQQ